ncbi:MAG: M3 family metallopeptidase [Alistipes sp.]|nr:M3 family metallopeptidase [Alistipes sp.]
MKRFQLLLTVILAVMSTISCTDGRKSGENPFFTERDTPFGVPPFDRLEASHFEPAFERAMAIHDAEIEAIVTSSDQPTFENTVAAYDRAGAMLSEVALTFEMLCDSDLTPEMQAVQERIIPRLTAHADRIRMDDRLFQRIRSVYETRLSDGLDADQIRLTELLYRSFVNSGAALDPASKERLKSINEELALVSVAYGSNLLAENNGFILEITDASDLEGLPVNVRDAARETAQQMGKGSSWVFTLHKPSLIPFLTYSTRRELREQLYKAWLMRGSNGNEHDNNGLVNDFIRLRIEKARLLGFDSYAAYVTSEQMAGTPRAVYQLLDSIWQPALARAKDELAEMNKLLQREIPGATFESWDWWYYAEKVRKQNYSLDEEMLRPYFSLDNTRNGIFFLANKLYGITFRPVSVPLYNDECIAYEVLDTDASHLGVLYFDFFPRAGKGGGAWCGYFREQSYDADGNRIAPVVGIVCNFTRPTQNTPALLSVDEVQTLFHEFGHALHFLFHNVRYRGLSDVEGDFVELPSQIMENWALEPEMLSQYALHYRTKEVIPNHLVSKLLKSKYFNQGFMTTELVAAALSDMDIHSLSSYEPFEPAEFERRVLREQRGLIPQIEPRYRYPYFSHIFDGGYSAGYYFYLWAEVLDKDAFQAFLDSGYLFDRDTAARFRKLLESGGSKDGMTLYREFRGQSPDRRAMLIARGLAQPEPSLEASQPQDAE